jgi:hypothetical protein
MTIGGSDGDVIVDDAAGESVTITKWVTRRASAQEVAGRVRTETTSEAIAAGNFVSYHNAGGAKVRKANATDDTKPVNAFAPAAIGNGANGTVILPGGVVSGLVGLTPGAPYFLDTVGGAITDTRPAGAGNLVQRVGLALSATELHFDPVVEYLA